MPRRLTAEMEAIVDAMTMVEQRYRARLRDKSDLHQWLRVKMSQDMELSAYRQRLTMLQDARTPKRLRA